MMNIRRGLASTLSISMVVCGVAGCTGPSFHSVGGSTSGAAGDSITAGAESTAGTQPTVGGAAGTDSDAAAGHNAVSGAAGTSGFGGFAGSTALGAGGANSAAGEGPSGAGQSSEGAGGHSGGQPPATGGVTHGGSGGNSDANAGQGGEMPSGGSGGTASGGQSGSGGANSGGSSVDVCTQDARECISSASVRICQDGDWVQEACPAVSAGFEGTCTGEGICGQECPTGEQECDGVCVDVAADSAHCGACGHGCGGGVCTNATCQAMTVAEAQDGAYSVALPPSGNAVFWLTPTDTLRCPAGGCTATPTRIAEQTNTSTNPYSIAVTNTDVYWMPASAQLASCAAAGCTFQSVTPVSTGDSLRELSLGYDGKAYLSARFELLSCSDGTCSTDPALSCVQADSLRTSAVTAEGVFYIDSTDPWGLYRCFEGVRTYYADIRNGRVVRAFGEYIYAATSDGSIARCHKEGCAGQAEPLVVGSTGLTSMAVDATGIYWTTVGSDTAATGELLRTSLDGTDPVQPMATGLAGPTSLQIAGDFAYWAEPGISGLVGSGRVARIRL